MVLPAPAGLFPTCSGRCASTYGAPRTRGAVPRVRGWTPAASACSPHPRGCSRRRLRRLRRTGVLPAPAGLFPGPPSPSRLARACSPHPRGCSPVPRVPELLPLVLPAPAGLFPRAESAAQRQSGAPRTRGAVPGLAPRRRRLRCAPRTRGPVPASGGRASDGHQCSPHPRGCSRALRVEDRRHRVLPAPAGLFPSTSLRSPEPACAPRARGAVPATNPPAAAVPSCSPRPRGCSQVRQCDRQQNLVLPVPTGVQPSSAFQGHAARMPGLSKADLLMQVGQVTFSQRRSFPDSVEDKCGAGYVADAAGAEGDMLECAPAFLEFGGGAFAEGS